MHNILDHGVEPAGDNIVLVAVAVSLGIVLVAGISYAWWRRRTRE